MSLKAAISSFWLVAPPEVLEVFNVYASVVNTHLRHTRLRIHVFVDELKNQVHEKSDTKKIMSTEKVRVFKDFTEI